MRLKVTNRPKRLVATIKILRWASGLGLRDTKRTYDNGEVFNIPDERADGLLRQLREYGAEWEIEGEEECDFCDFEAPTSEYDGRMLCKVCAGGIRGSLIGGMCGLGSKQLAAQAAWNTNAILKALGCSNT